MTELAHDRASDTRRPGTVRDFDPERGLGCIETESGERFDFHCIEIADGSRTIEVGTGVEFGLLPKLGRWEAAAVRPRR